ncbi:MAG: energy-coupling factor transporter ATPase [Peptoniphilaceae bacterium]|nr:energy-coupling factor transporter ATPase [Peptoniphilaceae bacterium]MDY6019763.1 energy-coupling factor transporter ATPase [Anaerococcus sp.]
MIEIKNLAYSYRSDHNQADTEEETIAINNLSLSIEKGEFVAILGHNGSGKSTLAKLLNAQIFPTQGDIIIDGLNTKDHDKVWEIREKCSMVFQNPDNQMVATTVEEEVAFGPENLQIKNPELRNRVEESLELVGMQDYKHRSPSQLSGGQKQRVSIAGVLAMQSDYIIFDEPTAMLDPKGRKDVIKIIKKLNQEMGKTIVLITHYMEEAVNADKIIVLNQGDKALEGSAVDVFSQVEKMKKLGLTVPQVTEVAYELKKAGIKIDKMPLTIDQLMEEL